MRIVVTSVLVDDQAKAHRFYTDVLEEAGLVKTRRQGRFKFHDLDTAPLREIEERWPSPDRKETSDAAHRRDQRSGR